MDGRMIRLVSMLFLTLILFFVEIVVGYGVGSIALVADSFHMLSDVLTLIVALYAIKLAKRKSRTGSLTYGWQRAEVLGALINGVFLIALCFTIIIEAVQRFFDPVVIENPVLILVVGGVGLIVNIAGIFLFHEHSHGHSHSHSMIESVLEEVDVLPVPPQQSSTGHDLITKESADDDTQPAAQSHDHSHDHSHGHSHGGGHLNMHGVFLHVLGDALGSIGVIISALVIWLSKWEHRYMVDPILSILLTLLILTSAIPLVRRTSHILLQGTPTGIKLTQIRNQLSKINGVLDIHELHVWQLSDTKIVASVHLVCENKLRFMEIASASKSIFHMHGIHSSTIQPEYLHEPPQKSSTSPPRSHVGEQSDEEVAVAVDVAETTCLLRCPNDDCSVAECCPPDTIEDWDASHSLGTEVGSHSGGNRLKTHHEFGEANIEYLDFMADEDPIYRRNFICDRIRPRQFFIGNILYRERQARKVSWDELFLDLLFVAVISKITIIPKSAGISWLSISDYYITFVPSFSSWNMIVSYLNRYGRNDTIGRLGLYLCMGLAFGMGLNAEFAFSPDPLENTSNVFMGTFVTLRAIFILLHLYHAYKNSEFASMIIFMEIGEIIGIFPYFASLFISMNADPNMTIKRSLWWAGYLSNITVFFLNAILLSSSFVKRFHFRIAMNIEHFVERMGLFVIIVLGEIVVSILVSSNSSRFSYLYLDSVLGLIIAISIEWLYFYLIDGYGGKFTHPLRFKALYGITWTTLHSPLCASLALAGAGIGILIKYNPEVSGVDPQELDTQYGYSNLRWLVGGSLAISYYIMTIIGFMFQPRNHSEHHHGISNHSISSGSGTGIQMKKLSNVRGHHSNNGESSSALTKSNDAHDKPAFLRCNTHCDIPLNMLVPRFPKWLRLVIRGMAGTLLLVVSGAGSKLKVNQYLGILAVITFGGVLLEEYGKMRIVSKIYSPSSALEDEEVAVI